MSEKRDSLPPGEKAARSRAIERRLFALEPFTAAKTAMFFVSFRSEVFTWNMIRRALAAGKRVAVPVTDTGAKELLPSELRNFDAELETRTYGILEPKREFVRPLPPGELDFVVVPGLAFDRRGYRVGYGGGFYDRLIGRLRPDVPLVALAYSFQLFDEVPAGEHDRKIHAVVTESETLIFDQKILDSPEL